MTTIKISELEGKALDYAVALCEGVAPFSNGISWIVEKSGRYQQLPRYSLDWAQGGPIIEREGLSVLPPIVRRIGKDRSAFTVEYWRAMRQMDENEPAIHGAGKTPLIAAMRCFVASKTGGSVEIPDELLKA